MNVTIQMVVDPQDLYRSPSWRVEGGGVHADPLPPYLREVGDAIRVRIPAGSTVEVGGYGHRVVWAEGNKRHGTPGHVVLFYAHQKMNGFEVL